MKHIGFKNTSAQLEPLGIQNNETVYWNLSPAELVEHCIQNGSGSLASNGALSIRTGEFTGRSPQDRFIVKDSITEDHVWWGKHNLPFSPSDFDALAEKITTYLSGKDVYVRDVFACADPNYQVKARVITQYAWSSLFVYNMFIRPTQTEIASFEPEWIILNAPGFMAVPAEDGTRQHNFAIINFSRKMIIVGGTGYTGEIKKGLFSSLNFMLPQFHGVLPMHCSANVGENGDTALFFGLSGTGKTTLSADPKRKLIGDDEHGWNANCVFNFEGGCYAKTIDLTHEKEPDIFEAIQFGALLENIHFYPGTRDVDYSDKSLTENTRVSYPIHFIKNIVENGMGSTPQNIFFLTCDAYGILPPISKLTTGQAMYHFISGYTAKVAGTEAGITEPQTTFSTCFGAPFMPLHPTRYAALLGEKIKSSNVRVWLINTGWSGGKYGVGARIKLKYTREMISAALEGKLDAVPYKEHPVFGLAVPQSCPNVPDEILNPENTWSNASEYMDSAYNLAEKFVNNFKAFSDGATEEMMAASPKLAEKENSGK
jgi:phosphoenolpyruvate carboxykinase (ATP)